MYTEHGKKGQGAHPSCVVDIYIFRKILNMRRAGQDKGAMIE